MIYGSNVHKMDQNFKPSIKVNAGHQYQSQIQMSHDAVANSNIAVVSKAGMSDIMQRIAAQNKQVEEMVKLTGGVKPQPALRQNPSKKSVA